MPLARAGFRCFHRLRVRWAEVDVQNIVFNAHYLTYFDTAITEYWRALALPYQETLASLGGDLYVVKATIEFHASARMDDQLDVAMKCQRIGNSSLNFQGAIFRGDAHLVTGEIVYVFADPATQTARPVPAALREALAGFEAGEAMCSLRVGPWSELGEAAGGLRTAVFVDEQRIPAALEWDEADAVALHAVAFNRLGRPVATGRLLPPHAPGVSKIGRMAVARSLRGSRLGRDVLRALMDAARARGDTEVVLHAQHSAMGFYRRQGFEPRGEVFEEAGIPHQEMVKTL